MTVNKRKKFTRLRGNNSHGYGSKKKHRGSGNRGGKGMAGSGKRADSKKPSVWKQKKYFGKYGFKSKNVRLIKAVNINYLEENILKLPGEAVKKENDFFSVSLEKLGFNKLLSTGNVTNKYKIIVPYASKKAVEKIKSGGGDVTLG